MGKDERSEQSMLHGIFNKFTGYLANLVVNSKQMTDKEIYNMRRSSKSELNQVAAPQPWQAVAQRLGSIAIYR
ncbi:MAG: hypothetical protein PHE02_07490 [Lachnospiraceae bacterium]|nr:hypothetical protein [Lachnospiraceae bacterium]